MTWPTQGEKKRADLFGDAARVRNGKPASVPVRVARTPEPEPDHLPPVGNVGAPELPAGGLGGGAPVRVPRSGGSREITDKIREHVLGG